MCTWLLTFVGYFAAIQMLNASVYTKCYGGYCFFISNNSNPTQLTFSNAEYECKQYNASLLTILNPDVQDMLTQFVTEGRTSGSFPGDVWLKATRYYGTAWTWVNGQVYDVTTSGNIMDQVTYPSYDYAYAYLGFGTRREGPTKQDYGYHAFNPGFYWAPYICEIYDATADTCSSRYNGNLWNGRCFKTGELSQAGTWFDARNVCLAHGDLASFNNTDLNTLRNVSWLDSTKTYWIGLNRNKWTVGTINDSEIKYTDWYQAKPADINLFCISVSLTERKWTDYDCNRVRGVICYNDSAATSTTQASTVPTSSSTIIVVPSSASSPLSHLSSTNSSPSENDAAKNRKQPSASADASLAIPIGVGVGVGGGVLLIIIIIVIVVCLRKRKSSDAEKPTELVVENKSDSKKKEKKETKNNNGNAIYATVSMKRDSTSPIVENEDPVVTNNSLLEYATLDFVNKQQD